MVGSGSYQQESMGSQHKMISLTSNAGEIEKVTCTPHILVEVTLELEVISLRSKTTEPCKGILAIKRRSYAMHDEDELPPSLTPLLMVRRMVVIDVDQGHLLVSLSHMKRNTTMNVDTRARLTKAWEMTLWVKRWTRFSSHPSRVRLKGQYFLGGFISQHSPSTMVERTLWSKWATSIREWLSIPKMKPWCARCSHPVWNPWRWDGLTA